MGSATLQGEFWGRQPREWADGFETPMEPLYAATFAALDATSPLRGRCVLDAGCGSGLAVRIAAYKGALPFGLDASEALLEVARARTPEGDFRVGDIEELPWPESTFDFVTAFNSI
jgi:SAM-dependent methyltransferase